MNLKLLKNKDKSSTLRAFTVMLALMISLTSMVSMVSWSSEVTYLASEAYPTQWSLERIFESDAVFKSTLETFQTTGLEKLKAFKGQLSSDEALLECLKLYESLNITASKLYVYSAMMQDMDATNTLYLENKSLGLVAVSSLEEAGAFLVPEILTRTDAQIDRLLTNPSFENFGNYLNGLKESRLHYFDENSERILALATPMYDMPYEIYTQLTLSDASYDDFTNHVGETARFDPEWDTVYWYANDATMREKSLAAYYTPYIKNANTLSAIYISEVQKNAFYAKARGYGSSLEAALDGSIEPEQYKALIEATRANAPLLKRYFELRRQSLGLDQLQTSDMHLAYTTEYNETFAYEKGIAKVLDALKPLGDDYNQRLSDFLKSGSIDVYPDTYKTTSQYSWGAFDSPVYVLLNYQDTYDDVSTLAHELGHAMHQTLIQEKQPYFDSSVPSFPAEVTSTLNELYLIEHFQNNPQNDEAKLYYATKELDNIFYMYFEQVILADFEMQVHETIDRGEALSLESLNQLWLDTVTVYYGDAVVLPDYYAYHWMTIPHLYQNHYVYSYAISFAAAQQIKSNIDAGGVTEVDAYLDFLGRGGSESPMDSLARIGIDFNSNQLYEAVFERMDFLISDVEQQLADIGDGLLAPPHLLSNEEIESILGISNKPDSDESNRSEKSDKYEKSETIFLAIGIIGILFVLLLMGLATALILVMAKSQKRHRLLKAYEMQHNERYQNDAF